MTRGNKYSNGKQLNDKGGLKGSQENVSLVLIKQLDKISQSLGCTLIFNSRVFISIFV